MNNNTNTTSSSRPAGSATGNKIKGAMEFVHGMGENVRGTALGVVDTLGNKGATKNDEIAKQGRLEMERGLGNMRGSNTTQPVGPSSTTTSSGYTQSSSTGATGPQTYPASGQNAPYDGGSGADAGAYPRDNSQQGYGAGNQNMAYGPNPTHPTHHRDDAITDAPQPELQQAQGMRPGQGDPRQGRYQQTDPKADNAQVTI